MKPARDITETEKLLLGRAYSYAALYSHDEHTQNAAILILDSGESVYGANQLPKGCSVDQARLERPEKYDWFVHAEHAAILLCAREGKRALGATMYCPYALCTKCAHAVINAGVREVITHYDLVVQAPSRWAADISKAAAMCEEAGVSYTLVRGKIGDCRIRFDGKWWNT